MDGCCMNCGESGNWCRCDEPPELDAAAVIAKAAAVLQGWPLFEGPHCLSCCPTETGYWLGYSSEGDFRPIQRFLGQGFDLNVAHNGVCYLVHLRLREEQRGQGHGADLYERLVRLAGELGCATIQQTPSGSTPRGESRQDYLVRRGWKVCGKQGNEVMRLTREPAVNSQESNSVTP